MKKQFLLTLLFLVCIPLSIFAATSQELDFKEPSSIVIWLMPLLTLSATWLIKKIAPFITGNVTLMVVPLLALAITWLTSIITGEASWLEQLLAGVGAVYVNQLYRSFTTPDVDIEE